MKVAFEWKRQAGDLKAWPIGGTEEVIWAAASQGRAWDGRREAPSRPDIIPIAFLVVFRMMSFSVR